MFNNVKLSEYLRSRVVRTSVLGEDAADREQKQAGYGTPMLVEYESTAGERKRVVLHTMGPSHFGHEHMSDRAQILLWQKDTFNRLPRHVRALDVGAFAGGGTPVSLGAAEEFFLLTEYAEGDGYFLDLERIAKTGELTGLDVDACRRLCDYLVDIHRVPGSDSNLYVRRIRELVGHGECIMGIADSYTGTGFCPADALRRNRTSLRRLALASEEPDASAEAGARGFSSVEYSFSRRRRVHRAGSFARRIRGPGR